MPEQRTTEIGRVVAAMRELSDELVGYVRRGCEDGAAAYACGALDALADQLERTSTPAEQIPSGEGAER